VNARDGAALDRVITERLLCERLTLEHLDELSPLLLDDRMWPTLWPHDRPPTRAGIAGELTSLTTHWARHGFGLWLLRERLTGVAVGRGGLEYTVATGTQEIEIAWAIAPTRWGQGLATEMARCALHLASAELGAREVVAFTLPHNRASRRVMEKTGFHYEDEIVHAGHPHALYRCRLSEAI